MKAERDKKCPTLLSGHSLQDVCTVITVTEKQTIQFQWLLGK